MSVVILGEESRDLADSVLEMRRIGVAQKIPGIGPS